MLPQLTRRWFLLLLALGLVTGACVVDEGSEDDGSSNGPPPASAVLAIQPVLQLTPVWCWAATAEMVFRHYGLPNLNPAGIFQCGIVAAWFSSVYPQCVADCSQCPYTMGPMSNLKLLIDQYGPFSRSVGAQSRDLSSALIFRALTQEEVAKEVHAGRPIVIGIAPGGGFALPNASQHVAVLVGYDYSGPVPYVLVNDPFPFQYPPYNQYPDPYLAAGGEASAVGQYWVPYAALVNSLSWANTIYRIK